jgi:Allophanate hydrolase subunit 1
VVLDLGQDDTRLVARLSGDTHLLLEIGAPELDLVLRFRAHALMQALESQNLHGVIDLTPGIRSLQVHYQPEQLPLADLLGIVAGEWDAVCAAKDLQVPSRIVHLPLSWDDPACQLAIEKYMTTVRKDAPWCPSNLEFIRRINDLPNLDEVQRTVFDASYLVMGLGDVYLGAPVATPLDPRHRLVTTKYNPARTWTAENSVGIGGAYMCVTAWKALAVISSSAARCRCGIAIARSPHSMANRGCCASSIRSVSTRSAPMNCCAFDGISPSGASI